MEDLLRDIVTTNEGQMFALLDKMVRINSGSHNKPGVDAVGRLVAKTLGDCEMAIKVIEENNIGNQLVARSRCPFPGSGQVLMVGHMDTVFPVDTDFTDYREDKDRAYGPGVIDMKGGLTAGIFALKALHQAGILKRIPLTFIFNSDEEIGSGKSKSIIQQEAGKSVCALVLEAGGLKGEIVTGRKGNLSARLTVSGRAGHAAFAGTDKASAILELAHKTLAIEALNDPQRGISANVGTVTGGMGSNTVAEHAEARLDFRFTRPEDGEALKDRMAGIIADIAIPGTSATWHIISSRPPMPTSKANVKLYERIEQMARRLGIVVCPEFRAGVSDANFIAPVGTPVIDGMGPIGGRDHSADEYMIKSSLLQRTLLLACTLADFSETG